MWALVQGLSKCGMQLLCLCPQLLTGSVLFSSVVWDVAALSVSVSSIAHRLSVTQQCGVGCSCVVCALNCSQTQCYSAVWCVLHALQATGCSNAATVTLVNLVLSHTSVNHTRLLVTHVC